MAMDSCECGRGTEHRRIHPHHRTCGQMPAYRWRFHYSKGVTEGWNVCYYCALGLLLMGGHAFKVDDSPEEFIDKLKWEVPPEMDEWMF